MLTLLLQLQAQDKSPIDAAIQKLFYSAGAFDKAIMTLVLSTTSVGLVLSALFIPITLAWTTLTKTWNEGIVKGQGVGTMFDLKAIGEMFLLYALLHVGYIPVCGLLMTLGDLLGRVKFIDGIAELKADLEETSLWGLIRGALNAFSWGILEALVRCVAEIVSYIVTIFAYTISRLLYVLGPLAIAFSILPPFKDKLAGWFSMFLNALCVPFTLAIINAIFQRMFIAFATNSVMSSSFFIIINTCYIISVCMAFWFTSFYVGSSASSKIMSMAVGAATALASGGMKMLAAKGGQAVAGGGGGNNPIEASSGGGASNGGSSGKSSSGGGNAIEK